MDSCSYTRILPRDPTQACLKFLIFFAPVLRLNHLRRSRADRPKDSAHKSCQAVLQEILLRYPVTIQRCLALVLLGGLQQVLRRTCKIVERSSGGSWPDDPTKRFCKDPPANVLRWSRAAKTSLREFLWQMLPRDLGILERDPTD